MAINSPRIAGEPATLRKKIVTQPVETGGLVPDVDPSYEGQVYVQISLSGINGFDRRATMFVGVDVDGTLFWAPIATGEFINGFTGGAWDEYYRF